MKTFVFCTSYFDNHELFRKRYLKWINYYITHTFTNIKNIFINDDRSDLNYMTDNRVGVYNADSYVTLGGGLTIEQKNTFPRLNHKVNFFTHNERKGGAGDWGSAEGWWRSMILALKIAKEYNFQKIIHLESDTYLISKKMFDYVDCLSEGWTAMFCPKYGIPESAIQIICEDQFENFEKLTSCGYKELSRQTTPLVSEGITPIEKFIPFTHVEQNFIGDRYGDFDSEDLKKLKIFTEVEVFKDQPQNIDYFCQVHPDTNPIAE